MSKECHQHRQRRRWQLICSWIPTRSVLGTPAATSGTNQTTGWLQQQPHPPLQLPLMGVVGVGVSNLWWWQWVARNSFPANTFCEGVPSSSELHLRSSSISHPKEYPQKEQEQLQPQPQPPMGQDDVCSTCRYTGTAVCTGLSLYCLNLASEAEPNSTTTAAATKTVWNGKALPPNPKHKPFFYGGALVWAAAGVYRFLMDEF